MAETSFYQDFIAKQAQKLGDKPYILQEQGNVSFAQFYEKCCQAANGLAKQGANKGEGMAVFMENRPEMLYFLYGLPLGSYYSVMVNTALRREGLEFILTNSEVRYLAIDEALYPRFAELGSRVGHIKNIFVNRTTEKALPEGTMDMADYFDVSQERPGHAIEPNSLSHLMYTSGTTGFPKGVVNKNRERSGDLIAMMANYILKQDDILYTCTPLFHIQALSLIVNQAMGAGIPFALEKRFSASGLWKSIGKYKATVFNAIGAMVPILMKQPENPEDAKTSVTRVMTTACPAHLWQAFEKRFGVKVLEVYGATDGATAMFNLGESPVGSVGKIMAGTQWKLIDEKGAEVIQGEPGELITKISSAVTGGVEYFKNPEATSKKVRGDWVHSGDKFYSDKDGNLFFVDRQSDFIRRRGENISSSEVERAVEGYAGVAESAAFAVPSDLGEDDVMVWVKSKEGVTLNFKDLILHCAEQMAYFMVPRYMDMVDDIPRTETLRAKKAEMKKQGVTDRTWDREKEMPDLKLKK